ncbi:MAG: CHAT domain-containing protein [Magnetococcales bacterium]|nr:CHAT domain-containing protein [Magnetococcales bacterium]
MANQRVNMATVYKNTHMVQPIDLPGIAGNKNWMASLLPALFFAFIFITNSLNAAQVTHHPALDFSPSLSADGRFIAFVSERSGNRDIWIKDLSPGADPIPKQLTNHPTADEAPALSPDGNKLVYVAYRTDTRGDLYLLDMISGEKKQLTGFKYGETNPVWSQDGSAIFYTQLASSNSTQKVVSLNLSTDKRHTILDGASSCSQAPQQFLICAKEGKLVATKNGITKTITNYPGLTISPRFATGKRLFFTRYSSDSNHDGLIDTQDHSSIWMAEFNPTRRTLNNIYQLTADNGFNLQPTPAKESLYYSNLSQANILKLDIEAFLSQYIDPIQTQIKAAAFFASSENEKGFQLLRNLVNNPGAMSHEQRLSLNLSYAEKLRDNGRFSQAEEVIKQIMAQPGPKAKTLAKIYTTALKIHKIKSITSRSDLKKLVANGVDEILKIGSRVKIKNDQIAGTAHIEASQLYLLVDDSFAAISQLAKVEKLKDPEIRAKALFGRGKVYRYLNDDGGLKKVFMDVIRTFGETTSWGMKAIVESIAISENGKNYKQNIANLRELVKRNQDLKKLGAMTHLRMVQIYQDNGESRKAVDLLTQVGKLYPEQSSEVTRSLWWKGEILSDLQEHELAADTYQTLTTSQAIDHDERKKALQWMVLQRVDGAIKLRDAGDLKGATKKLSQILQKHPNHVKANRAYIASKVMLGQTDETIEKYKKLVKDNPDNPVYGYSYGLALTYQKSPDFPDIIKRLEIAAQQRPDIPYFHQTLAWSHEQFETVYHGGKGHLEQAAKHYQIALLLTDPLKTPQLESHLLFNLGNVFFALKNHGESYRYFKQWQQRNRPLFDPQARAMFHKNFGENCFKTDRGEEAVSQYKKALDVVPEDKKRLRLEILERLALTHQTLANHAQAANYFSQALMGNIDLGETKNLAILQRNIGLNLYQAGLKKEHDRTALKKALDSYLNSLALLDKHGHIGKKKGKGLFNFMLSLGDNGSDAALGFDRKGEEKLLFGFVASTYETLNATQPALEFYQKKLALYPDDNEDSPGIMTEKAVTLNRTATLAYKEGLFSYALQSSLDSLELTEKLHLTYGTWSNLFNISKIATALIQSGKNIDILTVEMLVERLSQTKTIDSLDKSLQKPVFFALTNGAYLLHNLPEIKTTTKSSENITTSASNWHRLFSLKSQGWQLYTQAEKMVDSIESFSTEERLNHLINIKFNKMIYAIKAEKPAAIAKLSAEIKTLSEAGWSNSGWVLSLLEAENSQNDEESEQLLQKAASQLLAQPPPLQTRGSGKVLTPFIHRLSQLYTDLLLKNGDASQAFTIAEKLDMFQNAIRLNDQLGKEFFYQGLGEFKEEVVETIQALKEALSSQDIEAIQEIKPAWEELMFALFEEHPQAFRLLFSIEPDMVAETALSTKHPYIKLLQGGKHNHIFYHDGETLLHSQLSSGWMVDKNSDIGKKINQAETIYLSTPDSAKPLNIKSIFADKNLAHIQTLFDLLPSKPRQGLFHSRAAIAGDLDIDFSSITSTIPIKKTTLIGVTSKDKKSITNSHVVISNLPFSPITITTKYENSVMEKISLADISLAEGHTFFQLNPTGLTKQNRGLIATAIIRSGVPHVIMAHRAVTPEQASLTVHGYMSNLEKYPAAEALQKAWQNIDSSQANPFSFYGSIGLEKETLQERAVALYDEELALAVESAKAGEQDAALSYLENALSLIKLADRYNEFVPLSTFAVETLFKMGNYQRAAYHQKRILSALGKEAAPKVRSQALYTMGILYSRLENFDLAIENLEQAITIWAKTGAKNLMADGVATLGVIKENRGSYTEALAAFGDSFNRFKELGDKKAMADQYRRMGRIYHLRLAQYDKARRYFEKALALFKSLDEKGLEAKSLFDIGLTYEKSANFEKADHFYHSGLKIGSILDDHFILATGSLYLANTAWFQGEYQLAFKRLLEANQEAQLAKDPQLTIMIANTRGLIYWTLNENQKALIHLNRAIDLAVKAKIDTEIASSLNNRGLVLRQMGRLDEALESFEQAMVLDSKLQSRWGLSYDNRNSGIVLMKMGKIAKAEERFLTAEKISKEIANPINLAKTKLELGNLYRQKGDNNKASLYYGQAKAMAKQYHLKEVLWRSAAGEASILAKNGELQEAVEVYSQAIVVVENMRAALKIDALRNSFQLNKQDLYRDMITLLVQMGQTRTAFNYLERFRSRNFIDLLANQKIDLKQPKDKKALRHVTKLFRELDSLAKTLARTKQPDKKLRETYQRKKAQAEEAQLELQQSNPELSAFISVNPITLGKFEKMLEPKVGTLAYLLTEKKLFIWLTKMGKTTFKEVAATEEEITLAVRKYRDLMQNIEPVDQVMSQLYSWLIKPFASEINGLDYLGIIPHGPLHFLSFSALKGHNGYLVESQPIFYSASASAMEFAFKKRSKIKRTRVLSIGNPDLGSLNFDLPLAEFEAGSIRWSFPEGEVLIGKKATKKRVLDNISDYGIIHIAAHGDFQSINPLFSSLWLATDDSKNGHLTVKDIFSLKLNADLVTLSACQTGLGELQGSEIIGLNRAFLYAGTHALISSLWRVDDMATAILMKHFYRNYASMSKARSLRQAQLMVKKNFPHPSNWAGFNLLGDYK